MKEREKVSTDTPLSTLEKTIPDIRKKSKVAWLVFSAAHVGLLGESTYSWLTMDADKQLKYVNLPIGS